MEDIRKLADRVREVGYAIHSYLGPGHLERVYENALEHRLRNQSLNVETQREFCVYDEDGTVLGRCVVDLVVEDVLLRGPKFEVRKFAMLDLPRL
jgi:GxxExxY protein